MAVRTFGGDDRDWALIIGSDMSNSDAGLTLLYGKKPQHERDGISTAWRHVWRINVRWPITLSHRRPVSFPGRFQNAKAVQEMMAGFSWNTIRTASEIEAERLAAKKS